jgi:hypothetical protein
MSSPQTLAGELSSPFALLLSRCGMGLCVSCVLQPCMLLACLRFLTLCRQTVLLGGHWHRVWAFGVMDMITMDSPAFSSLLSLSPLCSGGCPSGSAVQYELKSLRVTSFMGLSGDYQITHSDTEQMCGMAADKCQCGIVSLTSHLMHALHQSSRQPRGQCPHTRRVQLVREQRLGAEGPCPARVGDGSRVDLKPGLPASCSPHSAAVGRAG